MALITAARHEGTIRVREGRQLGVAEFGPPDGRPVVWHRYEALVDSCPTWRSWWTGDRALLERPEFGAMFLDDLSTGGGRSMRAVVYDAILFTRRWGFDLADVHQPVIWWHGDADHIIPFSHGEHCVPRLPQAELRVLHGESHLGGLGATHDILQSLVLAD